MDRSWMCASALLALVLAACSSTRPYVAPPYEDWDDLSPPPSSEQTYRVFLIGDAGDATTLTPTLTLLQAMASGERSAVVFLGDNIYCCGLPDSAAADRPQAETRLRAQLDAVKDISGRIIFIPGNHDWNNSQAGGRAAVERQEAFVEAYLGRGNTFLPDDGFPGPSAVKLTDGLRLITLDTEWWLSDEKTFGDTGSYRLREPIDVLFEFRDLLVKYRNDDVLVVGHHPLVSNGKHAGRFSRAQHLTPFPLIGSIDPLYRRFIGEKQDLASAPYKVLRRELEQLFTSWDGDHLIYAAGHDHNLQYTERQVRRKTWHHLVSGSGSKVDYVAPGHGATFTASAPGFLTLQYYADHSTWVEAWTPEGDGRTGRLLFRHRLKDPVAVLPPASSTSEDPSDAHPDYRDSTVVAAAGPGYARGPLFPAFLLGSHHRALWATPVDVPVLDVARVAGGLTPLKVGGQSQSITMRLQGEDGHLYMLRSIDKVAGRIWTPRLRRTVAHDLVQDQTSMLHPYGALIVPPLADAAGVYHTNPRLAYVPDDPRLGPYRADLAGTVALFEERPDEDMSDVASMGNASNVIGYAKMIQAIDDDNDHRVDGHAWARARLLDMLIADWDRTPDNWRWGVFEPYELDPSLEGEARTEGKIYRPIPRDRDVAFARINGLFPLFYKTFVARDWQAFRPSYGYLKGLNKKGVADDRRFAAALTRSDWVALADSLRAGLTDAVIEDAVRRWPAPIYDQAGLETIDLLQVRRNQLAEVAAAYYELLARVVDIVGSNKHERFEVTRLHEDSTRVVVYKTTREGEIRKTLYQRTFSHDETEELRLFGLDGDDRFIVSGDARRGLRIRAVGGPGQDTFADHSRVRGVRRHTLFYDNTTGNTWILGPETRTIRSPLPMVNAYDPGDFQFDATSPVFFFGSNKDDGLFVGGGASLVRHGFRKTPYARNHRIMANVAAKTQAFNLRYLGRYTAVVANWDLALEASVLSPNNIRNFYGLGNETENDEGNARFYQARLSHVRVAPSFQKTLQQGVTVHAGPTFEYTDIREDDDRFAAQPQAGISATTFDDQWFGGLEAGLTLQTIDNAVNPRQGFRWTNTADLNVGLHNSSDTYSRLASDFTLYLSPVLSPQATLAVRLGGAHNVGAFPFYASNTLGGKANLRGYRSTRFAGRTSAYTNLELRLKVLDFTGYLAFGDVGVLGFFDAGRVWTDGESSRLWHQGYGGGLWFELFQTVVFSTTLGFSEDDRTTTMKLGFQY